jgi:hypothetical protein
MAPVNKALEAGAWTQSIIWSPRAPFRDFTQIEFNNGDDIIPEERPPGSYHLSVTLIVLYCSRSPRSQTKKAFTL